MRMWCHTMKGRVFGGGHSWRDFASVFRSSPQRLAIPIRPCKSARRSWRCLRAHPMLWPTVSEVASPMRTSGIGSDEAQRPSGLGSIGRPLQRLTLSLSRVSGSSRSHDVIVAVKQGAHWFHGLLAYVIWRATGYCVSSLKGVPVHDSGRVCVLQMNALGDVLMVTPLLRALIDARGPGRVDVVVRE